VEDFFELLTDNSTAVNGDIVYRWSIFSPYGCVNKQNMQFWAMKTCIQLKKHPSLSKS